MSSNFEKNDENEEDSNDSLNESNDANRPPGFSFSKSAIADLPSTAVQSIHIENETPVEVEDEAFVWKDVTPSGTKLVGKAKFRKVDMKSIKNKGPPSLGKTKALSGVGSTIDSKVGSKVTTKPSTVKSNPKVVKAAAGSGHELVKVGSVPKVPSSGSKNRIKERRPSGQGKASGQVRSPVKKASSLGKVGGSKTKLTKHREKHGHAEQGKNQQGRNKK